MEQRLNVHWQESDGIVVTITAMGPREKLQITGETTLVDRQKLTWAGSLLV
jgi:hypothetical protein